MKKTLKASILAVVFALASCGGGGGGSPDFTGAGNVTLRVSQNKVDTGDRTKVTIVFDELHPDGVVLKMRYSSGLEYIAGTSNWRISGKLITAGPSYQVAGDIAQTIYLVYELNREMLGKNNSGELSFELRAIEETSSNSVIEVDMDVFESGLVFSTDAPEFSAEYSTGLVVK
jgi:hypothetical protein